MQNLTKFVIMGATGFAVVVVSLYAILSEEDRTNPLDPSIVEECRSIARQSMDLSVAAAQADLDYGDPDDAAQIDQFLRDADDLQRQMDDVGCSEDPDRWVYGSFRQEMIELERYIADLQRDRLNSGQ